MSEVVDPVIQEVRRQGRAAIAAQSAAEACLAAVERLEAQISAEGVRHKEGSEDIELLKRLIPVFDALERIYREAERSPPPSLFERVVGGRKDGGLEAGIRLLRAQLDEALRSMRIEVDREVGVDFDEAWHRAVERRWGGQSTVPEVIEVIAPGYRRDGRCLREAQVVVRLRSQNESDRGH